ncbi:MAG: hypothetical protein M3203_11590 [Actinomycetota bacterium]|nr:hypothetical protein [Actinomycetota bacterium]
MPIAKGQPYGEPGELPEDGVVVRSDAEAAAVLRHARRDRRPFPALGLLGGDLCRTLGGGAGGDTLQGVRFTVDVGEALLDGRLHLFVAHLVARTRLWGRALVAMNAQWLGDWNLGPRAHPNDGLLDTYDARLPLNQLLAVRARLHHGAHLPHPGIKERRTAALQVELGRPLPVRLDGAAAGKAEVISVRAQPDALTVVI